MLLRGWWPRCEGVVCSAPKGFGVINSPAPEGAGRVICDIFTEIRAAQLSLNRRRGHLVLGNPVSIITPTVLKNAIVRIEVNAGHKLTHWIWYMCGSICWIHVSVNVWSQMSCCKLSLEFSFAVWHTSGHTELGCAKLWRHNDII